MRSANETDAVGVIQHMYRARRNYFRHAVLFGFFALGMALFLPAETYWREVMRLTLPNTGDLLILGFIWAALFAAHSATYWTRAQELREYRQAALHDAGKVKRSMIRLTDDGELADDIDAQWEGEKRKRR